MTNPRSRGGRRATKDGGLVRQAAVYRDRAACCGSGRPGWPSRCGKSITVCRKAGKSRSRKTYIPAPQRTGRGGSSIEPWGRHMRGDDVVALYAFRRLAAFADEARKEAKKRGWKPGMEEPEYLDFLRQLPDLLADQERRATVKRAPVVCMGPGRVKDPQRRIAALVARLDEVNARQQGQPGGVALGGDKVSRH